MLKFCGPNNSDKNISYFICNYSKTHIHQPSECIRIEDILRKYSYGKKAKEKKKKNIINIWLIDYPYFSLIKWEKYCQSHAAWYKFELKKNDLYSPLTASFLKTNIVDIDLISNFDSVSVLICLFDQVNRAHIIMIISFCIQFAFAWI